MEALEELLKKEKHQKRTNTFLFTDQKYDDTVIGFGNAISSPIRLKMLRQLNSSPLTLVEIAKLNNITNSTALFHLKLLQEADLVQARYLPGKKGKAQVFFVNFKSVLFTGAEKDFFTPITYEQSLQVGNYIQADAEILNVATDTETINLTNRLFSNDRFSARLLWTDGGTITYAFENFFAKNSTLQELDISLEICSEARFYRNDWKSDVTFSINKTDVATYTCLGDFGGVRGKLNPSWWGNENTQYGVLLNISIREDGTYINTQKYSNVGLNDLSLSIGNNILFSVSTKPNAEHYGGFNIFGSSFGNYPQDIVLTAKYIPNK